VLRGLVRQDLAVFDFKELSLVKGILEIVTWLLEKKNFV
jgi:hypothetical protein